MWPWKSALSCHGEWIALEGGGCGPLRKSYANLQSRQIALSYWTGACIHPLVRWLLSYLNGLTAAGA
jgi:hypothetical protein